MATWQEACDPMQGNNGNLIVPRLLSRLLHMAYGVVFCELSFAWRFRRLPWTQQSGLMGPTTLEGQTDESWQQRSGSGQGSRHKRAGAGRALGWAGQTRHGVMNDEDFIRLRRTVHTAWLTPPRPPHKKGRSHHRWASPTQTIFHNSISSACS